MYEAPETPAASASAGGGPARPGRPIDHQRLGGAFSWGKWVVIAAIGAGVALGQLVKPYATTYSSTVQIVWEPDTLFELGARREGRDEFRDFRAFVDSILSPGNLAVIRRRLGKKEPAQAIKGRYTIVFEKESSLVVITARGPTAKDAKKHAELLLDVLADRLQEIEGRRIEQAAVALRRDVDRARADVTHARKAYDEFRATHQISDITLETQEAIRRSEQLQVRAEEEARRRRLWARSASQTDTDRLKRARTELATARAQFSADHPRVQALTAEVRGLEASVRRPAAGSRPPDPSEPGMQAASSYDPASQEARDRLSRLREAEAEATALLGEIRVREERLTLVETQRLRADAALREPETGFRIVSPSILPESPSGGILIAAQLAPPLLLALLAIGFVLAVELGRLRLYTAVEVAYWGQGPVVGSTCWPKDPGAFPVLVEELADAIQRSRGTLLIVGATPAERTSASRLAQALQLRVAAALAARDRPRLAAHSVVDAEIETTTPSGPDGSPVEPLDMVMTNPRAVRDSMMQTRIVDPTSSSDSLASSEFGIENTERTIIAKVDDTPPPRRGRPAFIDSTATIIEASTSVAARADRDRDEHEERSQAKRSRRGTQGRDRGNGYAATVVRGEELAPRPSDAMGFARPMDLLAPGGPVLRRVAAWEESDDGPGLRRAARQADRVLVLVPSGRLSFMVAGRLLAMVGRDDRVAFLITGLPKRFLPLRDRSGPVERFWADAP